MKRYIFLFLALFLTTLSFAQKKVTIGILSDIPVTNTGTLLQQMQDEIRAVVGQDAMLVFKDLLVNNFKTAKAKENYNILLSDDTDIILSFGLVNTLFLRSQENYPKPVLIFGNINSDLVDLPREKETTGINNLCYVITPYSHAKDLSVFNDLYAYKHVAILVDDFLPEVIDIEQSFSSIFKNKEAAYTLLPISKVLQNEAALKNIDAVYLAGGFNLNDSDFNKIVTLINSKKIPSFSALGKEDVKKGILASVQPENSIAIFFRRIALNVEAIIGGANPSEFPLKVFYKEKLSINYDTAKEIEFPIRYSMLANANMIGGERNVHHGDLLSIVDIMNAVVDRNLNLNAESKNIDLAEQAVKTAQSNYLPELTLSNSSIYIDPELAEVSNGLNPEFSNTGSLSLNQLVYSETATANNYIQKEYKKAQIETYNSKELDALLNASIVYFNALAFKANVRIQNQNLQLTKQNLELAEQNFSAGASGKSDVLRFRSQLAQNTQTLIEAGNQVKQSYNSINQLMNQEIATKIDLEDAVLAEGLFEKYSYNRFFNLMDNPTTQSKFIDFLSQEAVKNSPELKNIGYNLNAVERNYKLNNWGRLVPTLGVQGQYNLELARSGKGVNPPIGVAAATDKNYNLGLQISLPIFQKNQRNINKLTAEIQEDQLQLQKEDLVLAIQKNVNDISLEIVNQIANVEISKVSETAAKESLDLTQTSYENGAVPVIQLIDAQNNYLQAQLASATANYQFLLAAMQLERSIGYFFLMHSETENQDFLTRINQYVFNQN